MFSSTDGHQANNTVPTAKLHIMPGSRFNDNLRRLYLFIVLKRKLLTIIIERKAGLDA